MPSTEPGSAYHENAKGRDGYRVSQRSPAQLSLVSLGESSNDPEIRLYLSFCCEDEQSGALEAAILVSNGRGA
ncbi:hypothetical protein GOODEAATRI_003588 [Goodea atripinnis]|uniref:Uncharacterized protein n=1 Tax=Goodea atripinnis TaxID=208336 RepID=A0ABV0PKJ6_9TELE